MRKKGEEGGRKEGRNEICFCFSNFNQSLAQFLKHQRGQNLTTTSQKLLVLSTKKRAIPPMENI